MSRGRWPVAGNPSDGRLAALLFALAWISYAYFFHGGSWGPNAALDMTRAIVEQHRVEIDDYRANTGDWASANGHFYLGKNPGSGLFAVPIYFVIHKLFPNAFDSFAGAQAAAHAMTALSFSLFAALGVALLFHWMRRYAPPAAAFGAAVVYALGSLIFLYGSTANAQVIVASCYATAVFAIERATRLGGKRWWLLAGFAAGYAVLSEPIAIFGVAACLAYLAVLRAGWRNAALFAVGGVPAAIAMAAYNLHAFGSVVTTGHLFQNPMFDDPNAAMGVLVAPSLTVLLAITVLPVRGLFWLSPVMVLSFHGLWITWRDPKRRAAALPATIVIAAYFAFNISYVTWHGGWCLGPRFLIPTMPFLAAALAPVFAAGKRLRRAAAGLAAVSVAVTLMVVSVNPFGPQIASMTNPIIQYVAPNFTSGVLSINNLAPFPPEPKLYPDELLSLEKPEEWWSSYNLGELLGYGGLLSLAPLIAWWGLAGFLAFKMLPRPEHATERAT